MKILAHVHAYPPLHNAGAEWMLHTIMSFLVRKGHECVVLTETEKQYNIDGVKVWKDIFQNNRDAWDWCDIGITHLGRAGKAWNFSQDLHKPIVHICHNDFTNRLVEVKPDFYMVYNSEWMWRSLSKRGYKPGFILHPSVNFMDYSTNGSKHECITLINCWDRKGGKVLADLARMMPDRKFIGVLGAYGEQIKSRMPNVMYIENTPNIKQIYEITRILLMPSVYESYGRTAVEAMCSGIPVIASATPGLIESLDSCGLFVPAVNDATELDYKPFKNYIEQLDEPGIYRAISEMEIQRAKELDLRNQTELTDFEQWLIHEVI